MNGRNSYLIVGVFVSVGFVALIAMILVFAGGRASEPTASYIVFFQRDISGLTLGAPVRYMGVDVGQVAAIRLTTENGTKVRVDLTVRQSTPVTTASYASLAFQGVTGVAFISLASDRSTSAMPLAAGNFEYPVIPARDVGLAALLSDGPEIADKLSELLDRASLLLDDDNQVMLARSLANIEKLTESLVAEKETIGTLPKQLYSVLEQIEDTVSRLQSTIDRAEPDLLATMATLNQASGNLAGISARLDDWLIEHDQDMKTFLGGGLAKTPALIEDTRNTVRELEKLLNQMRDNPSQLIYRQQSEAVSVEP